LVIQTVTIGPTATLRVLRHGDSAIGDHAVFPGRTFPSSDRPTPWVQDLTASELVLDSGPDATEVSVSEFMTQTETVALVVIVDGQLRFEAYGSDHERTSISQIFSVSKSVLSLMIGAAIDDGFIESIEDPITRYLPELGDGFDRVTLRHLLTMTSGTNYVENDNPFGIHVRFNYTDRLEEQILGLESVTTPGRVLEYRSGDNAMLGLALDRALGDMTLTDYLWARLWDPIGAETGGIWSTDRDGGFERTWCCLAVSARDLARIGQLVLDEGRWGDEQVISAEWIGMSTGGVAVGRDALPDWFRESPVDSYSFQWWLPAADRTDVVAIGKDGQYVYVDRRRGAVMVRLGWSDGGLATSAWINVASQLFDQLELS
jgi:CubicO group peptidase (beta-lactamase class C family)